MRRVHLILALVGLFALTACNNNQSPAPQNISYWGIGWALKGAPNRLSAAHPPIVDLLQRDGFSIEASASSRDLLKFHRNKLSAVKGKSRELLEKRYLGAFLVDGLGCSGKSYPVFDRGVTVAIFLVVDRAKMEREPWQACGSSSKQRAQPMEFEDFEGFLRGEMQRIFD